MAYQDELRNELAKDKYAAIVAGPAAVRDEYLAALMNAPQLTEIPNPEAQDKVPMVPASIDAILDHMDDAELAAIYTTKFADMMAAAAPTAADRVRALSKWMHEDEENFDLDWLVAKGGQKIIQSKNVPAITNLILVMQAAGMLDAQTVGDLQAALMIDDPTWTPVIYEFAQSISQERWGMWVAPSDVAQALE